MATREGKTGGTVSAIAAPPRPPRATSLGRILEYVAEMFPPAVALPYGVASFAALYFGLQALAAPGPLRVTWRAAAAAASFVLLLLLMRVYDELKDVENDARLGRAGDPRYAGRPIVTGRVRVEDLTRLRWAITAALVALNAPLGWPWPIAGFLAAFAVSWLSFRWFFCPSISRNLILAFATHNPISLVFSGYVAGVFVADFGAADLDARAAALLLGLWFPVAAWETSRKIRIPADETEYQTYSKVLGWKVAPLVPATFIALSAALLTVFARAAGLGWFFAAVLWAVAALAIGRCLLFRLAPTRERARLQPFAELYGVVANAGLAAGLALGRGFA